MLTRSTLFAAAALATIAGATLAPSSASAFGGHGHGYFPGHGPVITHGPIINRGPVSFRPYHFGYRFPYHFGYRFPVWGGQRYWPTWGGYRYWPRPYWWNYSHRSFGFRPLAGRPALGAGAAAAPAAMPVSAAASMTGRSGGCLTKQYGQDGTVVFKDLCTREEGVGAPAGQAPQPR